MKKKYLKHLHPHLVRVSKPGRYVGGEYGIRRFGIRGAEEKALLTVCIAFPDMYEIGMSNTGIRIIYNLCNTLKNVSCERVFAPDRDFEAVLRQKKIPLYSLETCTPVSSFDILGFSIGYELTATNVLNILELANIPIRKEDRRIDHPVVIAGGPAITNPVPFGPFFDAVLIGEGEGELEKAVSACFLRKRACLEAGGVTKNGTRDELLEIFKSRKPWWYAEKKEKTPAHTWNGFGSAAMHYTYYPVPNIKSAQDHGVIEIMRGCPQGCRFCHAGYFYRPCREKSIEDIISEADDLIHKFGYREITLSSLSSGDYSCIWELLQALNRKFASEKVSFSLPSLRIESFSLKNLEELSVVRKSGLTFAVETPGEFEQKVLNKQVELKKIIKILQEAASHGWKQAKFYFMIGLPIPQLKLPEEDMIIEYILEILEAVNLKLHINLGTFVPKPHTPFQWASQMDPETAFQKMLKIKKQLSKKNCKVSFHYPFLSFLEGIISRGDEIAAEIIETAYRKGARFDAWDDMFDRSIWEDVMKGKGGTAPEIILNKRNLEDPLPWDNVSMGISKKFLQTEFSKGREGKTTGACEERCGHPCGKCSESLTVLRQNKQNKKATIVSNDVFVETSYVGEILFSFSKKGPAVYLSHLNVMTIFERSFLRAGIKADYTRGYNPKPKLEFAQPLVLGLESNAEVASIGITSFDALKRLKKVNEVLPDGFNVLRAQYIDEKQNTGNLGKRRKKKSLMALYWGAAYEIYTTAENYSQLEEKLQLYNEKFGGIKKLERDCGGKVFTITVCQGKHGEGNIKRIGSFCTPSEDFFEFLASNRIIRTALYASDEDDKPSDYFSLMCRL